MTKDSCFKCGCKSFEVFEGKGVILYQCNMCATKWGEYDIRE